MTTVVEMIRGLSLGGSESLLLNRAVYLHSHRGHGVRMHVVNTAPQHHKLVDSISRVATIQTTSRGGVLSAAIQVFGLAAHYDESTIVYCHSPASGLGLKLRKLLLRSDFIIVDVLHSSQQRLVYRLAGKFLNGVVDCALAVSSDVASSSFARTYGQVDVVLGGVDRQRMREWVVNHPGAPTTFRSELGLPSDARLIVNVGSLTGNKNQVLILAAMAHRSSLADTHLVLVGDGPERELLGSTARKLGIDHRVHLLGRVPDGWQWTAVADVLVHPSRYEGLPVALMEAAALGTPIVATQFSGVSDLRAHGAPITVAEAVPDSLATTIQSVMAGTLPISETWQQRGSAPSYWDMDRYMDEYWGTGLGLTRPG